ncbi:MAG: rhomboid family intramembrane serine protease [Ruminiclostridium sp.]
MKSNFINSLIKYFIEKSYFNLISSDNRPLDVNNGPTSLIKDYQGTSVLIEVIDGDSYNSEQLAHMMESGAAMLSNINGRNASIFKLFLFDETPSDEKIQIIEQGQADIVSEKKFMKSISVNIMDKSVQKHFSVPSFDANIVKSVRQFFSKNFDTRETSPEAVVELIAQRQKDFEIQLKAKKPWFTYGIIAINIAVWLILKLISMKTGTPYENLLVTYGAKVNTLILGGQYWRLFTPMFLHWDEIHLALNCYSLYIVGSQVERLFGHRRFVIIYFVSGFIGCIASFVFSINVSAGASGAIFGLLGAMLYFAVKRPSLLKSSFGANLLTTLIINIAYGYMNKQIDNYGHLGGLLGGFLTTGVVYTVKEQTSKDKLSKYAALILVITVTIGGFFYAFNNEQNTVLLPKLDTLQTYDSQQNFTESEKLAEEILEINPKNENIKINVLLSVTLAEVSQRKFDEAEQHARQLVKLSPESGHFILGVIYYNTKELDKAKEELQAAKKLGSPYMDAINNMLSEIEKMNVK